MNERTALRPAAALERLRRVPRGQLEQVLERVDLDRFVAGIAGGWATGLLRGRERRELIAILVHDRLDELSPEMRARILLAMRKLPTGPEMSRGIRDALCSLTGEPFRRMKRLLNTSGDHHDLEHIVYEHLLPADREAVLAHIRAEGSVVDPTDLRILCDIDDTVRSMLHDARWPRGTVYPGVVALITGLDDGMSADPSKAGDVTFVTARPAGPGGLVEQYTRNALSHLGMPPHAVLGGSILNLFTKATIKARKLQNFDRERLLFPECRMVFIGDSGQADPQVGAEMVRRAPDFMAAVLIHDVVGLDDEAKRALEAQGVRTFDTYAGAARQFAELGLLDPEEAEEIAAEVRRAIDELDPKRGKRDALRAALERELSAG